MIEALAKQMKFQVMPVDEDHPELGSKLVGVVELRAEKDLNEGDLDDEEFVKICLLTSIHDFLYANLRDDLDDLRQALQLNDTDAASDAAYELHEKIKEI